MKRRIFSLLATLVVAISVLIGVSLTANAADSDGLAGHSINLAENVTLTMYVSVAEPADDAVATITLPDGSSTTAILADTKAGDNYAFSIEVAVKDIAKDVTITIPRKDGSNLAVTDSVLAYCEQYLAKEGENEFDGLVNALKTYADAADLYFDKDNSADSAASADFSGIADAKKGGTLPEGITHRSVTLLLESETTIRHYFQLANGKYIENYTFFVDLDKDGKCDLNERLTPQKKVNADGTVVYYVEIRDLTPNMLDTVYTVGVEGKADGATYTYDYGVLTYAKRSYAKSDIDTKNLAAAILAYNSEAGELKGDITFDANGGSAVVNQTYEYGVAFPVVATTSYEGYTFAGWYDEGGKLVTSIPANQTGKVSLTAKWISDMIDTVSKDKLFNITLLYNPDYNFYNGYCYTHTATSDGKKCSNCGYCVDIDSCTATTSAACATCEQKLSTKIKVIHTSQSSANAAYKGFSQALEIDGTQGVAFRFTTMTNASYNVGSKSESTVSIGEAFKAGYRQLIFSFDGKKLSETDAALGISARARTPVNESTNNSNNDVYFFSLTRESTDSGVMLFETATGVKLDTTKRNYEFILDMTAANPATEEDPGSWTMHLRVDGEIKASVTKKLNAHAEYYTSDYLSQLRVDQAKGADNTNVTSSLWIANFAVTPTYNVISYPEGVTVGNTAPVYYTTGAAVDLPETATKDGFIFDGWFADEALTKPISAVPANAAGDFKVYAKWIQATSTITFDANGVSAVESQTYNYGIAFPIIAPTTKAGYSFVGWYDEYGVKYDTVPANHSGDITLTARWIQDLTDTKAQSRTFRIPILVKKNSYNGYCENHTAENSTDGICKTCSFCTENCQANASAACSKCNKKLVKIQIMDTTESNSNASQKGYAIIEEFDGIKGVTFNFQNAKGRQQAFDSTTSIGDAYKTGYRHIIYSFDAKKISEADECLGLLFRTRTPQNDSTNNSDNEIRLISFINEKTNGFEILGTDTEVKFDTTARKYEFVLDMSEAKAVGEQGYGYITMTVRVDGVNKCTVKKELSTNIEYYTVGGLCDIRTESDSGSLWIANFSIVPTANVIDYPEDVTLPAGTPYAYTPGVAVDLPETAVKVGYIFDGWFADEALTKPISAVPANAAGDFKVYAKWIAENN